MSYRFIDNLTENDYSSFAIDHPLYNIYQSVKWAVIKKEWHHRFVGVKEDDKLVLASLLLYRDLPLGYTLFYLPKGPLADFENVELISFFFLKLKAFAKTKKAIEIKIDPNILLSSVPYQDITEHQPVRQSKVIDNLVKLGFKYHGFNKDMYETAQPRYSAVFYYYDDWLANYKNKATKTIAKALKKGVEIEEIKIDKIDLFAEIMSYTEKRKNISLRNKEYYQRIMEAYQDDAFMVLTKIDLKKQLAINEDDLSNFQAIIDKHEIAEYKLKKIRDQVASLQKDIAFKKKCIQEDGDIIHISCLLAVKVGNTDEMLYAGMNEKYRKYLAPYVSYIEGIKWGYQKGCTRCDFGGIQGTLDDGLTEFKGYFEPNIEEYIGEFDLTVNKPIEFIFQKSIPVYKGIRRFLRGKKK